MCILPQDNKENKDEEENQVSEAPKQKMYAGKSNYNSKVIFINSFKLGLSKKLRNLALAVSYYIALFEIKFLAAKKCRRGALNTFSQFL